MKTTAGSWNAPDTGATNSSGFSALLSVIRRKGMVLTYGTVSMPSSGALPVFVLLWAGPMQGD